ncbi:MAG: hypothetical protein ACLP1Y_15675 [Candidatus Acidiferrales bacterium]
MSDIHRAITALFTTIAQYGYDCIRHPITNFKTVWIWGVRLAHVLWACRISVLSAGAGLLIFYYVLQAQNLFADLSFGDSARGVLFWLCVFGAIFLFWAFPVHYGARDILEHDEWLVSPAARRGLEKPALTALYKERRSELAALITGTPRVLGAIPFLAVGFGLWFADRAMDSAMSLPEAQQARVQIELLFVLNIVTAALFIAFVIARKCGIDKLVAWIEGHDGSESKKSKVGPFIEGFATISLWGTTAIFLVAYFFPGWLAALAPRALLIPFLLGSLVLPFSYLVRYGYGKGLPIAGLVVCVAALSTAMNTHFDDLRTIAPVPGDVADRQIDITSAVVRWKTANNCTDACPPALIVAAEGGASRAAFMVATVVGDLMDQVIAKGDPADTANPGRRIFAISGVSGGAFGAAVVRAALADAAESANRLPPCVATQETWFAAADRSRDFHNSWRDCLQLLVSGDYLSPVFVGVGFRDNLFAPREWFIREKSWIEDRAALLEEAWERHYDSVTIAGHAKNGAACGDDTRHGLCRRFGYIKSAPPGSWVPLLLLTGTSVDTGRRIIASDLMSTRDSIAANGQHSPVALYSAAFDVFELLSSPLQPPQETKCQTGDSDSNRARSVDAPDIRLSTAALLSARFPIVSPPGVLRVATQPCYGDRIVDGGYFENSGLTTALDIAEALKSEKVTPIILWIQNGPITERPNTIKPRRPSAIPLQRAATPEVGTIDEGLMTEWLGLLAQPVETVFSTREGHGAEAADLADRMVEKANVDFAPNEKGFFKIGVHAQLLLAKLIDPVREANCTQFVGKDLGMTKVSMSWWLSAAVQSDLDAQMCDDRNRNSMTNLLKRLSQLRKQ